VHRDLHRRVKSEEMDQSMVLFYILDKEQQVCEEMTGQMSICIIKGGHEEEKWKS
jgi:hypothetical protein